MLQVRSVVGLRINDQIALSTGLAKVILGNSNNVVFAGRSTAVEFKVADAAVVVDAP